MMMRFALLVGSAYAGCAATPRNASHCPVRCPHGDPAQNQQVNGAADSFLQLSEPNMPMMLNTQAKEGVVHDVTCDGTSIYDVDYKSGSWVCDSCDMSCKKCDSVLCDLKKCMGQFFANECWCRKDHDMRLGAEKRPLWRFRGVDSKFMLTSFNHRFFCNKDCNEGKCAIEGLTCKPRVEACKPWWWCDGLKPPRVPREDDGWPDGSEVLSSIQLSSETEAAAKSESTKSATPADGEHEFEPNDYSKLEFKPGRWVCSEASMPPKIQNPETLLWEDRGYLALSLKSCKLAELIDTECYCFDKVRYWRGEDPMTSKLKCNSQCNIGACEGQYCQLVDPGRYIPPEEVPDVDPVAAEEALPPLNNQEVTMSENVG